MLSDRIHTVVSSPGPAEQAVLAGLGPELRVRSRVALEVRLRTLELGSSRSPTIVFLHGRGHAAPIWASQLAFFSKAYRVLAVDLPGFGHSAAAPLGPGLRGALDFFVGPIEELVSEEGSVALVGHSLGGLIAAEVAHRLGPAKVSRLALIAPMAFGMEVRLAARLYLTIGPERLARLGSRLGRRPGLSGEAGPLTALRDELLGVPGGRPLAKQAFDRLLPLIEAPYAALHLLRELEQPTLIIAGSRDPAFPLPVFLRARAAMRAARLVTLDAGHSPHLELPELTNETISAFLEQGD